MAPTFFHFFPVPTQLVTQNPCRVAPTILWHEDFDSGAAAHYSIGPIYYAKWLDPAKLSSWDQRNNYR